MIPRLTRHLVVIGGGIHYRFDIEAGQTIGRRVASLALSKDVHGHEPFPIP